jgi:hypothetical protein
MRTSDLYGAIEDLKTKSDGVLTAFDDDGELLKLVGGLVEIRDRAETIRAIALDVDTALENL